jgi:hypothetical protein
MVSETMVLARLRPQKSDLRKPEPEPLCCLSHDESSPDPSSRTIDILCLCGDLQTQRNGDTEITQRLDCVFTCAEGLKGNLLFQIAVREQ